MKPHLKPRTIEANCLKHGLLVWCFIFPFSLNEIEKMKGGNYSFTYNNNYSLIYAVFHGLIIHHADNLITELTHKSLHNLILNICTFYFYFSKLHSCYLGQNIYMHKMTILFWIEIILNKKTRVS